MPNSLIKQNNIYLIWKIKTQFFKFELSLEEANSILLALQELHGKICNPLRDKIRKKAQAQIAAAQAANQDQQPEAANHAE